MKKTFVSVVVPVYNVEPFLPECVESILAQTWQNYEVILVDDGSTDSSGKMCDDYARKNTRVRVIHKKMGDCLLQEMRALILHWATILHL